MILLNASIRETQLRVRILAVMLYGNGRLTSNQVLMRARDTNVPGFPRSLSTNMYACASGYLHVPRRL